MNWPLFQVLTDFLLKTASTGMLLLSGAMICSAEEIDTPVHHDMSVKLNPVQHEIQVHDRITLPSAMSAKPTLSFVLHRGLKMDPVPQAFRLSRKNNEHQDTPHGINGPGEHPDPESTFIEYDLLPGLGKDRLPETIELSYQGKIDYPLESDSEEYARSFSQTRGIISEEGTVISASSGWYPRFDEGLVTFRMDVEVPEGRSSVSQGNRETDETGNGLRRTVWNSPHPMDDIYLIEAPFTEYEKSVGNVKTQAFLRNPDPGLASKYLDATAQYLEMYTELIGPYPYSKFALVENFWETGYGMPSFTLLGPKIIRFPFILQSSYPHEILHNWWGNSVFVDYEQGNWCEGITAYLADHLMKEIKGQGEAYRRDTLQRYLDFVRSGKDFPLVEFRSRHDAATEAIGYGKSLMLYHMLRMRIGDELFKEGLRLFYERFAFKRASFTDLAQAFSDVSEEDLHPFFTTWTERAGAPLLRIAKSLHSFSRNMGTRLTLTLAQDQEEEPFPLRVPLAVYVEGRDKADIMTVDMKGRLETFALHLPGSVIKVEIDPGFDLFRRLAREEIPPTLGQAFGAEKVLIVLPEAKNETMQEAWKTLAERWASDQGGHIEIQSCDAISALPPDRAIWIFGRQNAWRPGPENGWAAYGVSMDEQEFSLPDATFPFRDHAMIIALRHPNNPDLALCWIAADLPESVPGLGRKLPHY
ncbi:MAG: M1 family aminopeptidase, partial [Planctomycetota bacterium]